MKKSKEPGTPPAGPAPKRRRIALPRTRRRRAAAAAGGLLVFLLILLACATLGDPLSRAYSRYHAVDWANETWPGHDFRVTDVQFEPVWCYYVTVQASDSIDTHFTLTVVAGIVRRTDYELAVANLQNTKQRFFDSLYSDVQNALTAAGYAPVGGSDFSVTVGDPNLAMDHTLTLDMPYDKGNIPPRTSLWVNGWSDAPDAEQGKAILREVYRIITEAGIDIDEYAVTIYDASYAGRYGASPDADNRDDTYESGWVTGPELAG